MLVLTYYEMQVTKDIIKPIHYHIGEWLAIKYFLAYTFKNVSILDLGCGIGYGVGMMNKLGFTDVVGIDLHPDKIKLGKHLGYNVDEVDILSFNPVKKFEYVWSSHSFEHMLDPDAALQKLLDITTDDASFTFILPYPDLNPSPVHSSAKLIGTNVDDEGNSVIRWFESRGLKLLYKSVESFREPEIWLGFVKSE